MNENSLAVVFNTFLFLLSLLPAVYLRYLPFRTILAPKARRRLLQGYALIFFAEFAISVLLFFSAFCPTAFTHSNSFISSSASFLTFC